MAWCRKSGAQVAGKCDRDYGSAEQHYRRAIAIDPEHADAHCNLGDLLEKRKADCHSAAGQPRPSWCL